MSDNAIHNVEHEDVGLASEIVVPVEADDSEIQVRFEVGGKQLDLSQVNRVARRLLEGQAKKYRAKYADMVGPNNERPTIIVRSPRMMDKKVEIVLEYPESMKGAIKNHEKATRIA